MSVQGVAGGIFNAYCWTHATFTLPTWPRGDQGASTTRPGRPLSPVMHYFRQPCPPRGGARPRPGAGAGAPRLVPVGRHGALRPVLHLLHRPLPVEELRGEEGGETRVRSGQKIMFLKTVNRIHQESSPRWPARMSGTSTPSPSGSTSTTTSGGTACTAPGSSSARSSTSSTSSPRSSSSTVSWGESSLHTASK